MTATEHADAPYTDGQERLLDELHRAELLLRRHVEAWWADRGDDEAARGLFVSDAEVDRLLASADASGSDRSQTGRRRDRALDRAIDRSGDRIEAREAHADAPTRLASLAAAFDLDRRDLDALVLALAPELDRSYEKVFGYLQDDVTRRRPTVGLVGRVLATDRRDELAGRRRFERGSPLVDERLVIVADDGGPFAGRPVGVPRRVASYLVGGDDLPAAIAADASFADSGGDLSGLGLPADRTEQLRDVARAIDGGADDPPLVALGGRDDATARRAVAAVAPAGHTVLQVDAAALSPERRADAVALLRREVHLREDVLVHVAGLDEDFPGADRQPGSCTSGQERDGATGQTAGSGEDAVPAAVVALDAVPAPVVVSGDASVPARLAPRFDDHRLSIVDLPDPDRDRRRAAWADLDLPDGADPAALADAYRLTRGEIEDAVATARALAGGEPDAADLRAGCRAQASHRLEEHARAVRPGSDWDDIVLPGDTEAQLREAAAQVRHRGTVFDSWGFSDRYSRGNGVTLLFTGPSGTGKTMAAEVVAGDVGLSLFAVDLAATTSKYVGETEKNLGRIFDEAERANAVLFFDEADALFGERSEVSDAHDRYANVEVDYLLQRLETHDGCVILASNLAENIDEAFRRRINLRVDFPRPDRAARAEIWRGVLPEATPREAVDVDFLADFELTGGNVRNVATTAAFMAAEAGEPVGMAHLVRALRRELQKTGRLFERSDFGEYADHLPRYE